MYEVLIGAKMYDLAWPLTEIFVADLHEIYSYLRRSIFVAMSDVIKSIKRNKQLPAHSI